MRTLIQRVSRAKAAPSDAPNQAIASIQKGLLIFAGFEEPDTLVIIEQMAQKIRSLRLFSDQEGKINLAGAQIGAEYLLISQFTLYAECKYGNRPSFAGAAEKSKAKTLFEAFTDTFVRLCGQEYVKHTPFGSDLAVELVNDGPVTIWLDSRSLL